MFGLFRARRRPKPEQVDQRLEPQVWRELHSDGAPPIILSELLHAAMARRGAPARLNGDLIELTDAAESPLLLRPAGLSLVDAPGGAVRSVTVVQVAHPWLGDHLFEYQHGVGSGVIEALQYGFEQFTDLDLPVLRVAAARDHTGMMAMELSFSSGGPTGKRRILLGPTGHMVEHENSPAAEEIGPDGAPHAFCPCCLTTRSLAALEPLLRRPDAVGLRLLASRAEAGVSADCRVNGEDFEPGVAALRDYATGWPGRGFEMRKQFVLMQWLDAGDAPIEQAYG